MNPNDVFCNPDRGSRAHSQNTANEAGDQECQPAKAEPSFRRRANWLPEPGRTESNHQAQNGSGEDRQITTNRCIPAHNQIMIAPRFHGSHKTMRHHAILRNVGQHLADCELVISCQPHADHGAVG